MLSKMTEKFSVKSISLILALSLIFATVVPTFALTESEKQEYQNQISDIKSQIEENKKKIAEMEEKASSYDSEIEGYQDKIDALQSQIDLYNDEISVIQEDIDAVDDQITAVNNEIEALNDEIKELDDRVVVIQQKIADTYTLLGKRIRVSYMSGKNSALEYLLTADDFEFQSFLERIELLKRIAENDDALVKTLQDNIEELEKKVEQINSMKEQKAEKIKELDEMKADLEDKKQEQVDARQVIQDSEDEIQSQLDKVMSVVNSYNEKSEEYQEAVERGESAIADYEEKLAAKAQSSGETGSGTTGDMIWPLPYNDTYISSVYGMRTLNGITRQHNGIDICRKGANATYGSTIVAVKEGTVIEAVSSGYSGGFGLYVGISHGNGVETYYAHMSSVCVSVGDYVTQGQKIGCAGNTGYSFGSHLHFGIMINGGWYDPLNYLSRPSGCEIWE